MVVAGPEGLMKQAYRKFSIKGPVAPGDDFAMMREVLQRRFGRALKEHADRDDPHWPDLVLIDGGAGQLSAARAVMEELGVGDIPLVAIAKGPDRNAGANGSMRRTRRLSSCRRATRCSISSSACATRAHRFAITSHRAGRSRAISQSELDEIAGIGAARKRALLHHFGSARSVKQAGLADLAAVPGINRETARRVYAYFHPGVRMESVS